MRVVGMSREKYFELLMEESNRIGDRDAEEELMLWIGFKETDYT